MKTLLLLSSVFFGLNIGGQTRQDSSIEISLKNNTAIRKSATIIAYEKCSEQNSAYQFELRAGEVWKQKFKTGTRIFKATEQQTNEVMSGKSISGTKPFLTVKKSDNRKVINLYE